VNDVLQPTIHGVRRLARALAHDAQGAEDLAQEAWLAALRRGIGGGRGGLEGWLSGATRILARARRREEARRRERERRVELPDDALAAAALATRLEVARRVVEEVQRLEEPQRSAVVLRYFEELPPRALARRLGVPVNTARSRVRRGLDTLRQRLDRASLLALVPLALEKRPSPLESVGGKALAIASGAVVLTLVAFGPRLLAPGESRRAEAPLGSGTAPVAASAEGRNGGAGRRERVPAGEPAPARMDATRDSAPAPSPPTEPGGTGDEAEIRGRLLDASGAPRVDAEVTLDPSRLHMDRLPIGATPALAAEVLVARTDAEGTFVFRVHPLPYLGYTLTCGDSSWHSWEIDPLEPRAVHDLGALVLARGGTIAGNLLDRAGGSLAGWRVHATSEELAPGPDGSVPEEVFAVAELDADTGTFELEDLPDGTYRLSASHALAAPLAGPTVELAGAGRSWAELDYEGPDLARRIRVEPVGAARARLDPSRVRLRDPDGGERRAAPLAGTRAFVFDGLPPGECVLAIDDPRFLPWTRTEVRAGTLVLAELVGSAALELRVTERGTTAPIERFRTLARPVAGPRGDPECWHREDEPLVDGRLAGLVPGAYVVSISAEGHGTATHEIELRPGETLALEVALGRGTWARGLALRGDGRPAAGLELALHPLEARDGPHGRPLALARADEAGRFRVQLPGAGRYWLQPLSQDPGAPSGLVVSAGDDETLEGLQLVVP